MGRGRCGVCRLVVSFLDLFCVFCVFFLFVLLLFLSTHLTKEFHVTNTMIHMAETNSCGHKYILLTDD